eukprot:CAMPEP_0181209380 /NCGR_PEP_ID=MMETSP1096-20121128/22638_1 /TAXON_ID=156174 ORGANISM="Chrysochromulina ericina, Strain CCMP281" /NCGR_SAMPLE_ID=MMETSP1096 /ASSEMBLY_ACC=CAM_ASM_000453 /LENGTH=301 /DNA_ID=CAMNT_0023300543 /DNA_START=9 /DNA_END=915 /DNA_ORIENTATION=+
MGSTRIPTLGHADGICHMFVDAAADLNKAETLMIDSKTDYPAACNALETLLIHESLVPSGGGLRLIEAARQANVELFGGPRAADTFGLPAAASLRHEYGALAMAVEIVTDVEAAIDHINSHGSGHTDVVVSEDAEVAERFMRQVDSADVFHNCSSRFADGFRFGLGAEVGISTSRIHARGPVGVEGLLTTRTRLVSDAAHTVSDFSAGRARYTHQNLMAAACDDAKCTPHDLTRVQKDCLSELLEVAFLSTSQRPRSRAPARRPGHFGYPCCNPTSATPLRQQPWQCSKRGEEHGPQRLVG